MLLRTLVILKALVPFLFSFARDRRRFILFGSPRTLSEGRHLTRARRLRDTAARLGPTFIKLAQILGARADLLPDIYVEQFATLHDHVAPIPAERIKKVIREELGGRVRDRFPDFEDEPIAAASLGQVHVARIDGQKVVVKVIRPGVRRVVHQDLRIVHRILAFVDAFTDHAMVQSLLVILDEFSRLIVEEMDLRLEAKNAETFRHNFAGHPVLIIPEIHHDLTTRSVLVMRYHEGTKVTDLKDDTPDHSIVRGVIEQLIEIYGQQVLVDGFFHADPHPGNILVRDDGRIVLLDFGMVIHVDETTRQNLLKTTIAWARRDIESLIENLYELGVIEPQINFTVTYEIAAELIDIVDRNRFTQQKIRKVCNEVLDTFYRFPLRLPTKVVYLFKTAILIEGLGVKFDPTFDGGKAATPVIKRMMTTILPDLHETIADYVKGRVKEAFRFAKSARRVMERVSREELRVRAHEQDLLRVETYVALLLRRAVISLFILSLVMIAGIIYHKTGNPWWLIVAVVAAAVLLIPVMLLPIKSHKRLHGKR